MFREIRRVRQTLSIEQCQQILQNCSTAVLALNGLDGYPYGVPVNYCYSNGKIYFHSGKLGHKIEAIKANNRICLTVISNDEVVGQQLTTAFESVIVFGRASIIENESEKLKAHIAFCDKYCADFPQQVRDGIDHHLNHMEMIEIVIDHISGKQGNELMKQRG